MVSSSSVQGTRERILSLMLMYSDTDSKSNKTTTKHVDVDLTTCPNLPKDSHLELVIVWDFWEMVFEAAKIEKCNRKLC